MTKQNKNDSKPDVNVEEILKKQAEEFAKQQKEFAANMQAKMDKMAEQNKKLTEELNNLKTNTAEENALLGEKIAKVSGEAAKPNYDPFEPTILYKVKNKDARIETLMTGDEVKGIIGAIDRHLEKRLINGDKTIEKHPYVITFVGKENEKG